jgi:nitrogen fixation protein FixH
MRFSAAVSFLLGILALLVALTGCGRAREQTATPPGGVVPAAARVALGTQQAAGPFQVTLSTSPAPPKAGETRFQAKVSRDGQPVSGATVTVSLSMPSMKMTGPDVTLQAAGDRYEGSANLGMAGEWEAKTTVNASGETGTATYRFTARS